MNFSFKLVLPYWLGVKNLLVNAGNVGLFLGQEDPMEKDLLHVFFSMPGKCLGNLTDWEEPGGLQSMGVTKIQT